MILSTIGTATLGLICAWVFGGIALRLAGTFLALAGLLGLCLGDNANGIVVFAVGTCLWLAGHVHFRLRHGVFKSGVVEYLSLAAASAWRYGLEVVRTGRLR